MEKSSQYIHYGCGNTAPVGWRNFDAAPSLVIQSLPVVGSIFKLNLKVRGKEAFIFPDNVSFGDIVKGLPGIPEGSCRGVYCSHVLEHLSRSDFYMALKNTYKMLSPNGIFRLIVPDLKVLAKDYINHFENGDCDASHNFMKRSFLGRETTPRGLFQRVRSKLAFPHHLWMWDELSMAKALGDEGFVNITKRSYRDTEDEMFNLVETEARTIRSLVIECRK